MCFVKGVTKQTPNIRRDTMKNILKSVNELLNSNSGNQGIARASRSYFFSYQR